jgi:hypothetical protein
MNLAPIILFVDNRLEHTKKTIESLKLNKLSSDSSLFIFADGNKNEDDLENVNQVRDYISSINGFKEIKITLRKKNLGLADSVISGVTEVIEKYGKVIVLEDDIVTSPYFLKFMNETLDYYENDEKIFTISGYNFPVSAPESYKQDIYISPRPSSWGWATWKDRWEKVDWNLVENPLLKSKKSLHSLLDKAGKDLAPMLLKSVEGKISSWAVKYSFTQIQKNAYCIFPLISLAKNIGADATGTNFDRTTKRYDVLLQTEKTEIKLSKNLNLNDEILNQIRRLVKPGLISYLKYRLFNLY